MAIKKRSATVVHGASGAAAAVKNPQASKSSFWGELPQHVMSGIGIIVMAIKKRSATVVHGASGAAAAVKNPQASKSSFWGELPQHVMSGISRMVPTLIMGGVILAFSQLIAYSWLKIPADIGIMDALNSGKFSGFDLSLLKFAWLSQSFGGVLFGFAIPMFAAFVAVCCLVLPFRCLLLLWRTLSVANWRSRLVLSAA